MAERKRPYVIKVYFEKWEYERVLENMSKLRVKNKSTYGRKMMCDGYIILRDSSYLKELTQELGYISRALNSLARRANHTQSIYQEDLNDIAKEYCRARTIMNTSIKKIIQEYKNE